MTHQLNIFLLLFGALQGVLLSIWFLRNQVRKVPNIYFGAFLLVVGFQLTFKVITKTWVMEHAHFPYLLSYKLPYLIGPLLYLYVRSRKHPIFRTRDLLHFIPFVIAFVEVLMYVSVAWRAGFCIHPYTQATLQLFSLGVYTVLALRQRNVRLNRFIYSVFIAEGIIIITLALMYVYYLRFPDVRLLFVTLTLLIYWISYQVLSEPDLFIDRDAAPILSFGLLKTSKYAHSSLREEEAIRIERAITQLMRTEKIYTDTSLTIDSLAERAGTSRHHLSQVFNERLKKTYAVYINELRLEEARQRLTDPANRKYTIAGVAMDAGFNSVSAFNDLFKKRYGVTPSKFRDSQVNQMIA